MQNNINYIKKYKPSTPYFNLQLKEFYYSEEKNCLMDNNGSKKILINLNISTISTVEEIENKSESQKYTGFCILNSDFSIISAFLVIFFCKKSFNDNSNSSGLSSCIEKSFPMFEPKSFNTFSGDFNSFEINAAKWKGKS